MAKLPSQYSIVFSFEQKVNETWVVEWMRERWQYTLFVVCFYILAALAGRAYMRSRRAFDLRPLLTTWNILLALFSTCGFFRMVPEMIHALKHYGLTYSVCTLRWEGIPTCAFWMYLFALSKLVELGDTIFIVLRKKKLTFLHLYHHAFVLVFTWYSVGQHVAPGRWFAVMNYFAHMVMYSYYAFKATGIQIPRFVPIAVTSCQILQLLIACFVTCFASFIKSKGEFCQWPEHLAYFSVILYLSLAMLFFRFFYFDYINPPQESKKLK